VADQQREQREQHERGDDQPEDLAGQFGDLRGLLAVDAEPDEGQSEVSGSEATKAAKALERLAISETATMTRAETRTLTT